MKTSSEANDDAPRRPGFMESLRALKPFWVSDQKIKARLMLGGIIALTVAEIALTAGMGLGFQAALNALVAKNAMGFAMAGGATVAAMGASTYAGNKRQYVTDNLGQNWRGWLTRKFNDAWLGDKAYLKLQHSKKYAQNPDQRIAETVGNVTNQTLNLGLGAFRAVIGGCTFALMLWHISPLMVGAAAACSAASFAATHLAGSSMRGLWRGLMDTEAKFRHALTRVRDNAKTIALTGHEPVEKETLSNAFNSLDETRRKFYKTNMRVGVVWSLSGNAASIVPIAMSAPKFFAGTATLGGLELARQSFSQFYSALGFFPQAYTQLAGWSANVGQLMEFKKDLEDNKNDITVPVRVTGAVPEAVIKTLSSVRVNEDAETDRITFRNVALQGPDGNPLVDFGSTTFVPGDSVMLSGPPGSGKSAGLAAMRGAWTLGGSGEITVPAQVRFVPQEDYFPDRSLRGMICAPDPESKYTRAEVEKALTDAGLAQFIPDMDDPSKRGEYWKNTLSGGQKNKVGFAGAFLHAKDTKVLIVDEITAALDAASEARLYPMLLERMKHGIVISIAHHDVIKPLHSVQAVVGDGKVTYTRTFTGIPDAAYSLLGQTQSGSQIATKRLPLQPPTGLGT
ncbi:MAG: ABC transporter ATP-binding protein/permease [Alphaproteobacteria bacterium]|nr:MAG: ABC transporter ATP-binding protein/permease [Alphaproteobacteria bacterium]